MIKGYSASALIVLYLYPIMLELYSTQRIIKCGLLIVWRTHRLTCLSMLSVQGLSAQKTVELPSVVTHWRVHPQTKTNSTLCYWELWYQRKRSSCIVASAIAARVEAVSPCAEEGTSLCRPLTQVLPTGECGPSRALWGSLARAFVLRIRRATPFASGVANMICACPAPSHPPATSDPPLVRVPIH